MTRPETPDIASLFAAWKQDPPSRIDLARTFEAVAPARAGALLRQWKDASMSESVIWPTSQRAHVAIAGFSTLDYLVPHVEAALLADGFVPRVTVAPYNQLFQSLADPGAPVLQPGVDLLWIWCDLMDLAPAGFARDPGSLVSEAGLEAVDGAIAALLAALRVARGRTRAMFLVNELVPNRRSPLGIAESGGAMSFEGVYRHANQRLAEGLAEIGAAHVFGFDRLVRRLGLERSHDVRLHLMADAPYTPEFQRQAAAGLRPFVRALKGTVRKVLVLDADNTLWGGVVGEDGWDGVRIGGDPVGNAFARFQEVVLELYRRGVILALNSKNNRADAEEVFQRRAEMVLELEHFASTQLNWVDKVTNCRAIASEINVGLDSLVFWDDNPAERLLVREALPEVFVVEVPSDTAQWAGALCELTLFDTLELTAEDAERGRMYAEDRGRREAATTASDMASFLQSLELKVATAAGSDQNIPRIVSLLSRTNQFNLTTRRHSEAVIREMASSGSWSVLSYAAEDRFGSYGIVGVTLMKRQEDVAEIDTALLSCRAMGKGIETAMLAALVQQARAWDVRALRATYIPSKKNAPVRSYLADHGFVPVADRDGEVDYELELGRQTIDFPAHIVIGNGVPS